MQNDEFRKFLYSEIADHLEMIVSRSAEDDYNAVEYHANKIEQLLEHLKVVDSDSVKIWEPEAI